MKSYLVSVPCRLNFYVPAEDEEKAKRLAAAATWTPIHGMEIIETSDIGGGPLCATLWANDEVGNNAPTGILVEVLDGDDCKNPSAHLNELAEFAASNGNEAELTAALKPQPRKETNTMRNLVIEHNIIGKETGEKLPTLILDGAGWGDDYDNLCSSKPEDPVTDIHDEGFNQATRPSCGPRSPTRSCWQPTNRKETNT